MVSREQVQGETAVPLAGSGIPAKVRAGELARSMRVAIVAHWHRAGLVAILALAAALNLFRLDTEGYANTYYAAAVKSMLTGWRNFFFASFDSGGFVTVDKPPLGLWIQTISAKLFGFSGLSILLPQALAGVASVALLYWLVRRTWGPAAGLLAALALATMPISVVANRNNTHDSLLILALLGAAWATTLATETGRLRWLLLGATLVGLGFNIKMLQAYLVLPALLLVYLLGAPRRWRTRLWQVALAGFVTLAVSLAWVVAVDLIPADQRPYIGSSGNNSALSLVLGYNGLTRLTLALPESVRNLLRFIPGDIDLTSAPGMSQGVGDPGLLRLFNDGLGGQASWLLALAVVGVVAAALTLRPRLPLDRRGQSLVIWGGWLLGAAGFFSVARFFHLYYLTMLGPAIAALAGIGGAALWQLWRRGGVWRAALPLTFAGAALAQAHLLEPYTEWNARLARPLVAVCLVAAALILIMPLRHRLTRAAALGAATVGMLALLVTPLIWSVVSVQGGNGAAWLPQAGPSNTTSFGGGARNTSTTGAPPAPQGNARSGAAAPGGTTTRGRTNTTQPTQNTTGGPAAQGARLGGAGAITIAGPNWDVLDSNLVQFLLTNQGDARYLVATTTSTYASIFMLATDRAALALGGYQGWDRILTPQALAALVTSGEVRYFYLGTTSGIRSGTAGASSQDATADLVAWVGANCTVVPSAQLGTTTQFAGQGQQLYDCAEVTLGQP